jgi:hypothetical protein
LSAPAAEEGAPISLDGEMVRSLIVSVVDCGRKLIDAVDDWLYNTKR